MRAAVLRAWNDLAVEQVDVPDPGPGEVLLRVRACGLCGTDLKMVRGPSRSEAGRRTCPSSLVTNGRVRWSQSVRGSMISSCSPATRSWRKTMSAAGDARCAAAAGTTCARRRAPRATASTGTPPLVLWPSTPCVRRRCCTSSQTRSARWKAHWSTRGRSPVHALRRVEFLPGSTVAVFGPGLLGLLTAAVVSASGGSQIIMVGRGNRLELAAKMGCDDVVDYEKEDPVAAVRRLTAGRGVDYVFDCTGNPKVPAQAIGAVRRGGRVAILGLTGG